MIKLNIKTNREIITKTSVTTCLGVIIDDGLTRNEHITKIKNMAIKRSGEIHD